MADVATASNLVSNVTLTNLTGVVLAIGALGTAAAGLVDASKASNTGGVSRVGFDDIKVVVSKFIPPAEPLPSRCHRFCRHCSPTG